MKKRLYIILASICLCSTIIAIIGILYLKDHKKTYSDDTETLAINSSNNEVTGEQLEDKDTNLNNNKIQSNEDSNSEEKTSNSDNNNSQTVISTNSNSNSKVINKSTNSKTSEKISNQANVESTTATNKTTNNNSSGTNIVNKEQTNQNNSSTTEQKKPEVQLNLSKYDRYEKGLNGGYKCFKKNTSEISKLRSLINEAIQEFGYTDVRIVEDGSIISNRYFTANKTNVENGVYDSEGFTIHYYAETEYILTADGRESIFQVRSYLKVK